MWAETLVDVWFIVSVILVGFLPKLELVEIFHDNRFISTWVHMRKDRLGHGHNSYSLIRGSELGVAGDVDLPGYDSRWGYISRRLEDRSAVMFRVR
jgi:hypothetical protein